MSSVTVAGNAARSAQLETVRSRAEADINHGPFPAKTATTTERRWRRNTEESTIMNPYVLGS